MCSGALEHTHTHKQKNKRVPCVLSTQVFRQPGWSIVGVPLAEALYMCFGLLHDETTQPQNGGVCSGFPLKHPKKGPPTPWTGSRTLLASLKRSVCSMVSAKIEGQHGLLFGKQISLLVFFVPVGSAHFWCAANKSSALGSVKGSFGRCPTTAVGRKTNWPMSLASMCLNVDPISIHPNLVMRGCPWV